MTLTQATITLILVMDPLGNIPFFLSALTPVSPERRRWVVLRESSIAFIFLVIFLFFGPLILEGMHISQPALEISGGIILFLIAIRMIFPPIYQAKYRQLVEPFIVPLAVPLIAGPSTLATVILIAHQVPNNLLICLVAVIIAWLATTIILVFVEYLRKILGERVLMAIERLMGMILTMIAVQMFLNGFEQFLYA